MERIMVGISLRDRKTNDWLRRTTKLTDVVESYKRRKWRWASKIAQMDNDRWAKLVTEWRPWMGKRGRGRPRRRWRDDIVQVAGVNWLAAASDKPRWRRLENNFAHPEAEAAVTEFFSLFRLFFV
jgi:hypothetical protein